MIQAIEKTDADIVFSQFLKWDGTPKTKTDLRSQLVCNGRKALIRIFNWRDNVSACTKIYKREAIGPTRFPVGKTNEDFPFMTELLLRTPKVCILPDAYYRYRVTPASITHALRPAFFDIFDNLDFSEAILPSDDADMQKNFRLYALTMHIISAIKIIRARKKREYREWLKKNRHFIRKSWKTVLFDSKLSLRWKAKALYPFVASPF